MPKLVGRNFARLRAASGLTQEQVAERANITQQYVSGIENGRRNPTVTMIQKIANALGVSHLELVQTDNGDVSLSKSPVGDISNAGKLPKAADD